MEGHVVPGSADEEQIRGRGVMRRRREARPGPADAVTPGPNNIQSIPLAENKPTLQPEQSF